MIRFINESAFRPESFLSFLPFWNWNINGYSVVMIFWNVLLALLALYLGYRLAYLLKHRSVWSWPVGLIWLLMIPNTAYIMSDMRHIVGYCPPEEYGRVCQEHAWMTLFFFSYALLGWVLFVYATRPVLYGAARRFSINRQWLTGPLIILIALGIMMGLVNRWNSWEIITDPYGLIVQTWKALHDLTYLENWLIMSILLYFLYEAGERLFKPLGRETKLARFLGIL